MTLKKTTDVAVIKCSGKEVEIHAHQVYYFGSEISGFFFGSIYNISKNRVRIFIGMNVFRTFYAEDGVINLPIFDGRLLNGAPVSPLVFKE